MIQAVGMEQGEGMAQAEDGVCGGREMGVVQQA